MAKKTRKAKCPTCRKLAPVDEHDSLRCPRCKVAVGRFDDTLGAVLIDLKLHGANGKATLARVGVDPLIQLRDLVRQEWGTFDAGSVESLRDKLQIEHGLNNEQSLVAKLPKVVNLLGKQAQQPNQATPAGAPAWSKPMAFKVLGRKLQCPTTRPGEWIRKCAEDGIFRIRIVNRQQVAIDLESIDSATRSRF